MYYLLEYDCDNTIDVVEGSNVVCEKEFAEVGEKVLAIYLGKKKRQQEYEAVVVNRSDDHEALKREMDEMITSLEKEDDVELGRGKRMIKRKSVNDSDEDEPTKTKKTKTKAQTQKIQKLKQQQITAKDLISKIQASRNDFQAERESDTDNDLRKENEELKEEVRKLKTENKRLRRERAEALEVNRLLETARHLVDQLAKTAGSRPREQLPSELNLKIPSSSFLPIRPIISPSLKATPPTTTCTMTSHSYTLTPSPRFSASSPIPSEISRPYDPIPTTTGEQNNEEQPEQPDVAEIQQREDPRLLENVPGKPSQLLFDGSEPDTVQLVEGKGIFVLRNAKEGLSNQKNQTTVVRSGLRAIFKHEYLLTCSVKGGLAKGIGKTEERREALDQKAIATLIEFSKRLAEERAWKIVPEKDLVMAVGTKLSEMRAAEAKKTKK